MRNLLFVFMFFVLVRCEAGGKVSQPEPSEQGIELTAVNWRSYLDGGEVMRASAQKVRLPSGLATSKTAPLGFVAFDAGLVLHQFGIQIASSEVAGDLRSGIFTSDSGVWLQRDGFEMNARACSVNSVAQLVDCTDVSTTFRLDGGLRFIHRPAEP